MSKNPLNQNTKYAQEIIDTFEPDFIFSNEPLNRFQVNFNNESKNSSNKHEELAILKKKINSIENCKLKSNSKKMIMGVGNINSPIM